MIQHDYKGKPNGTSFYWRLQTNTANMLIPFEEILDGGPGKDGIPSIDNPTFIDVNDVENIPDESLGILVETSTGGRFYPYTILVWHEIVNDTIDGVPVAVTFCPLCGSAITFNRQIENEVYEFGVSVDVAIKFINV